MPFSQTYNPAYVASARRPAAHPPSASNFGMVKLLTKFAVILFVVVLLVSTSVLGYTSFLTASPHTTSTEPIEIVVGNTVLNVPKNVVRDPNRRISHSAKGLQLYAHWPNLEGVTEQNIRSFETTEKFSELIFLTLEPRAMMHDMSGRLKPIYARFFDGVGIKNQFGLVQQPLDAAAGFVDEDLFYDPSSPYPFTTRCTRLVAGGARATCLRDIHIGTDLMLTYRFDKKLLNQWLVLDKKIQRFVGEFRMGSKLGQLNQVQN